MAAFSWRKGGGSDPPKKAEATCQRCLQKGHFTYECKKDPEYLPRKKRKTGLTIDEVPDTRCLRLPEIYIGSAWWMTAFPGLAITLTVLGIVFLGDWLRDALNPRLDPAS